MYSKNRNHLLLWGATGQAIVLNEFLEDNGFQLSCLFDRNEKVESPFNGIPIFHDKENLLNFISRFEELYFGVSIGGDGGRDRLQIHHLLKSYGLKPATLIHPQSHIASDAKVEKGSQILINATICSRVEIGREVIVNSSSSIDHECHIADGVHIGPGSVLSGSVEVGSCTFIGSGSVVLPRVKIGKNTTIGAGSVVTKNIPDNVVAFGNPCSLVRKKSE